MNFRKKPKLFVGEEDFRCRDVKEENFGLYLLKAILIFFKSKLILTDY